MIGRIRILIVDDSKSARKALSELLKKHANIEVVATADNARVALELIESLRPDLVVMDLHMPEMEGPQAPRIVRRRFPAAKVVGTSMDDSDQAREAFQASGAHGFIWKLYLERQIEDEIQRLFDVPELPAETVIARA